MKRKRKNRILPAISPVRAFALAFALVIAFALSACGEPGRTPNEGEAERPEIQEYAGEEERRALGASRDELSEIPEYAGEAYTVLNDGRPGFTSADLTVEAYQFYSGLDGLGRCGFAMACLGPETLASGSRGSIGDIRPVGWHTVRYDDLIEGNYLYNRCHLIAFSLSGQTDNVKNLVTGTRYLNVEGMQPFELAVLHYIQDSGNHVLYRSTPIYSGSELLCRGVRMEAYSVEDDGNGICFNIFAYNVQPGIEIDYKTGESARSEGEAPEDTPAPAADYIANKSSMKFHYPSCESVAEMKEKNKWYYSGSRDGLIALGYSPCKACKP